MKKREEKLFRINFEMIEKNKALENSIDMMKQRDEKLFRINLEMIEKNSIRRIARYDETTRREIGQRNVGNSGVLHDDLLLVRR